MGAHLAAHRAPQEAALNRKRGCLVAAVLVLVGGWIAYRGASSVVERKIEQQVAAQLPKWVGANSGYEVKATAGLAGASRGVISAVSIEGRDVEFRNGLRLKQVHTTLRGIHVDREKKAIRRIESAEFELMIAADQLAGFLARQYPDLPNPRVTLHDGYLTASVTPTIGSTTVNVEIDAEPVIESPDGLRLQVRDMRTSGTVSEEQALRTLTEELRKAVIKLSDWGFKGRLISVGVSPEGITLSGTGNIVGSPAL